MSNNKKEVAIFALPSEQEGVGTSLTLGAHTSLQTIYETRTAPDLLHSTLNGPLAWQARNENTVARVVRSPVLASQFVGSLRALGAWACIDEEEKPLRLAHTAPL